MRLRSSLVLSASLACAGALPLAAQAAPVDDVWRLRPGDAVRVQLLARDVILATSRPENLSVRSVLTGTVARIVADACEGLHAAHDLRGPDGAPLHVVHRREEGRGRGGRNEERRGS